jgi:hypothetical protein
MWRPCGKVTRNKGRELHSERWNIGSRPDCAPVKEKQNGQTAARQYAPGTRTTTGRQKVLAEATILRTGGQSANQKAPGSTRCGDVPQCSFAIHLLFCLFVARYLTHSFLRSRATSCGFHLTVRRPVAGGIQLSNETMRSERDQTDTANTAPARLTATIARGTRERDAAHCPQSRRPTTRAAAGQPSLSSSLRHRFCGGVEHSTMRASSQQRAHRVRGGRGA